MAINRFMLPAEDRPFQTYVSQHVDLPIEDIAKYRQFAEDKQKPISELEGISAKANPWYTDVDAYNKITQNFNKEAEALAKDVNKFTDPFEYERRAKALKNKYAPHFVDIEKRREGAEAFKKMEDKYGKSALYGVEGQRLKDAELFTFDEADNIIKSDLNYTPRIEEQYNYKESMDKYFDDFKLDKFVKDLEPSNVEAYLRHTSTETNRRKIDEAFEPALNAYLGSNEGRQHLYALTGETNFANFTKADEQAAKDEIRRQMLASAQERKQLRQGQGFQSNPEYARKVAAADAAAKRQQEIDDVYAPIISVLEGSSTSNSDGSFGTTVAQEDLTPLLGEQVEANIDDVKQSAYYDTNEKIFVFGDGKSAHDIMVDSQELADVSDLYNTSGEKFNTGIDYLGIIRNLDASSAYTGKTNFSLVPKETLAQKSGYFSTPEQRKEAQELVKQDWKNLEANSNFNILSSKGEAYFRLLEKFGWDGKGMKMFNEDGQGNVKFSSLSESSSFSIDPNNPSYKKAISKVKYLQNKYPSKKEMEEAVAVNELQTLSSSEPVLSKVDNSRNKGRNIQQVGGQIVNGKRVGGQTSANMIGYYTPEQLNNMSEASLETLVNRGIITSNSFNKDMSDEDKVDLIRDYEAEFDDNGKLKNPLQFKVKYNSVFDISATTGQNFNAQKISNPNAETQQKQVIKTNKYLANKAIESNYYNSKEVVKKQINISGYNDDLINGLNVTNPDIINKINEAVSNAKNGDKAQKENAIDFLTKLQMRLK